MKTEPRTAGKKGGPGLCRRSARQSGQGNAPQCRWEGTGRNGMSAMKIALVQKKAVPNSKTRNAELLVQYIQEASSRGADLVLFPEMWSNGYAPPFAGAFDCPTHPAFERERREWFENAVAIESDYVDAIRKTAARYRVGVCATFLSKSGEKFQNTAIIIDRSGKILLNYAKVHTCDFSLEKLLQHGSEFKVCEFEGVQLGVMICYDREFPESARVLMLKGAEIILVPNACDMNPARVNQLSARAFENMVGIAMANYPGKGWGGSCAFSPIVFDEEGNYQDNTIVSADDTSEDILIAEFDMDKIRAYREHETWGNAYRKPAAYSDLIRFEVKKPFIRNQ